VVSGFVRTKISSVLSWERGIVRETLGGTIIKAIARPRRKTSGAVLPFLGGSGFPAIIS